MMNMKIMCFDCECVTQRLHWTERIVTGADSAAHRDASSRMLGNFYLWWLCFLFFIL